MHTDIQIPTITPPRHVIMRQILRYKLALQYHRGEFCTSLTHAEEPEDDAMEGGEEQELRSWNLQSRQESQTIYGS